MACRVRYLNSEGIHREEIPGIDALASGFPEHWLLYASLQHFPRDADPMEVDALVVMDDRVLVLELKNLKGDLSCNGDQWILNKKRRFRSPVHAVSHKARVIYGVLRTNIPGLPRCQVDGRVVLTADARKDALPEAEQALVWSLEEAKAIGSSEGRQALLSRPILMVRRPYEFETEFERVTNNPRIFKPREVSWHGYEVLQEDVAHHPKGVWRDHRAQKKNNKRFRGLVRIWEFNRLQASLNSPENRTFVAEREMRAIGYLKELGSQLAEKNGILPIVAADDEILTQYVDIRDLPSDWRTLDAYLAETAETLTAAERDDLLTTLLGAVAELHVNRIAHRDLGPKCIWVGSPTRLGLTGLMSCQMPDETSLGDWRLELQGYAPPAPEDQAIGLQGTGQRRDVFHLGRLAENILGIIGTDTLDVDLKAWLDRSVAFDPVQRFSDAREMLDEFGRILEKGRGKIVDQTILDLSETSDRPYKSWPNARDISESGRVHIYQGQDEHDIEYVVKIWFQARRGINTSIDLALVRLFDGVNRLKSSPIIGAPVYRSAGLHAMGAFVVYDKLPGVPLSEAGEFDVETGLVAAEKLLACVSALHLLGCTHGDLNPTNIMLEGVGPNTKVYLNDLFDIAHVGDGQMRTLQWYPNDWEIQTDAQIDRHATLQIILKFMVTADDPRIFELRELLKEELHRPTIETFEPAAIGVRRAIENVRLPQILIFTITSSKSPPLLFRSDDGRFHIEAIKGQPGVINFTISGIDGRMLLTTRDGRLVDHRFDKLPFHRLVRANVGVKSVRLSLTLNSGPDCGLEQLIVYLQSLALPLTDEQNNSIQYAITNNANYFPKSKFDVERYWQELVDLEENLQPEVEILREVSLSGDTAVYRCERVRGNFDFDPGSMVDVRLAPKGRRIGDLDLERMDSDTIALRNCERRLRIGERVVLLDRRAKASLDRKRRGVERILERESPIPDLIEYFAPGLDKVRIDYGHIVHPGAADLYGLNEGQKRAFEHVLRFGPVGLLQGPPGTGKTHFSAAVAHYLITYMGARRILVASQSHEGVNNFIQSLTKIHKKVGGRPNLLRIGSKGITSRIRPYHSSFLRERFQKRFAGALKHRVGNLGAAVGLSRSFVEEAVEIDRQLGVLVRRHERLMRLAVEDEGMTHDDHQVNETAIRTVREACNDAAVRLVGDHARELDPSEALEEAFHELIQRHPNATLADMARARQLLHVSNAWIDALGTSARNFEEFLAKTRTIVTGTCVGLGQSRIRLEANSFDWVIVDEAARCTSGEIAVPLQLGRRVLLVGDHRQLKPMLDRSVVYRLAEEMPEATDEELISSDFERAFNSSFGTSEGQILDEQYRMVDPICRLISKVFYEPSGVTLRTSKKREADQRFHDKLKAPLSTPITWVDTSNSNKSREQRDPRNRHSFWNLAEVTAVLDALERIAEQADLVTALRECEDEETPIGVICMYKLQKEMLDLEISQRSWSTDFKELIRVDTVDAYQGKENSIVILSLVRHNSAGEQGHVGWPNRCNVALSRAKERLIIIGARNMWSSLPADAPMRQVLQTLGGLAQSEVRFIAAREMHSG